ncbi:MAG: zf-TFIIB domain-containing protein [Dehalococcoidia bacterium]|nr:zf-TFIIB domain-containing protein [Dehalococcoidia bacterium]
MRCLNCKSDMIVVEYNNIELDHCNDCHSVWFDSAELDLLLKSLNLDSHNLLLDDILKLPEAESSEKKRRCPICRKKLRKTTIGEHPSVLIDVCPQKHGLWFDSGEVAQLLKHLAGEKPARQDAQQQVISFLGETFQAEA